MMSNAGPILGAVGAVLIGALIMARVLFFPRRGRLIKKKLARRDGGTIINKTIQRRGTKGSTHYEVTFFFRDETTYTDDCTGEDSYFIAKRIWTDEELVSSVKADAIRAHEKAVLENEERDRKKASRNKKRTALTVCLSILAVVIVAGALVLILTPNHKHAWTKASCTAPETCSVCGKTRGKLADHRWLSATCTEPRKCITCGKIEGEPRGHTWIDATCISPKKCCICGETEGVALGHQWTDASCKAPKTCSRCGITEGTAFKHVWSKATDTTPSICYLCGEMQPLSLPENGHVFIGAGKALGSEITINAPDSSYYIKLKDTRGRTVYSFFVRANSSTTVKVPAGQFYVYFASGDEWYGPDYCFGDNTYYSKDNNLADLYNYTYTYTLYKVTDGNFKETPISKKDF